MSVSGNIKVWVKENWDDESFSELLVLDIQNLRSETKGMGAGSATILLNDYDSTEQARFKKGGTKATKSKTSYENYWVFIQDTNLSQAQPTISSGTPSVSASGPDIIWFGYIGDMTKEVQLNTGDCQGTISLYEFGHYIQKNPIKYEWANKNGFNPVIDGVTLGNKDKDRQFSIPGSTSPYTYQLQRNANLIGIDPVKDKDSFFTVKEVIGHLCLYSSYAIDIYPDFSQIIDTSYNRRNGYMEGLETIPSYEGAVLTDALNEILDSINWHYEIRRVSDPVFGDTDAVFIVFTDEGMNSITNDIILDKSCQSFSILSEEQKYDSITIKGDRILVYGSLSTYTPMTTNKSIGLFPDWDDKELTSYVKPLKTNFNIVDLSNSIQYRMTNAGETSGGSNSSFNLEFDRALGIYEQERKKYKKPYRKFNFSYCDAISGDPKKVGECLATWGKPGKYQYLADEQDAADNAIPFFPNVVIQDDTNSLSSQFDSEGKCLLQVSEAIFLQPSIEQDLEKHKTPPASEMLFSEHLVDDQLNSKLREPCFFYRTLGRIQNFKNVDILTYCPLWLDATQGGSGLMSCGMTLDWKGVTLDVPAPECFASNYKMFYQDIDVNGYYDETVKDFSVKRTEWNDNDVGATRYDPVRMSHTYRHIGHWGRMVMSFGAFSNQRLQFTYGKRGDRKLLIEDDSYKMTLLQTGYVWQTDHPIDIQYNVASEPQQASTSLKWQEKPEIIINDLDKLKARMEIVWEYYQRDKRALKLVNALYTQKGAINNPIGELIMYKNVGKFINTVTDVDGTKYDVNSNVQSLEYDFSKDSPRIIIQTEYPSGPRKTREKKVVSANKVRK